MAEERPNLAHVAIEREEARRQRRLETENLRRRQWLRDFESMNEPEIVLERFDSGVRFDADLAEAFDMFATQGKPVTQELVVLLQILREVQRVVQTANGKAAEGADVQPVEASVE